MKYIYSLIGLFLSVSLAGQDGCTLSYASRVKYQELGKGIKVAYREEGKGKQTLILVHGLGGNLSHWNRNISELGRKYRVIALDLPNYGLSSAYLGESEEETLGFYSDVIHEFIRTKKLKRVVLTGHSMGGQTALITALKYPRSVQKLVLAAPAGIETFTEQEAQLLRNFVNPAASKAQDEATVKQSFRMNFVHMPKEAEALIHDRLMLPRCERYNAYWEGIARGVKGMLSQPVFSKLETLRLPVLVVFGADDGLIPNRYLHPSLTTEKVAETAREKIAGSTVRLVPGAGHMVMFEKPAEFNEILFNFLNN